MLTQTQDNAIQHAFHLTLLITLRGNALFTVLIRSLMLIILDAWINVTPMGIPVRTIPLIYVCLLALYHLTTTIKIVSVCFTVRKKDILQILRQDSVSVDVQMLQEALLILAMAIKQQKDV